MAASAKPISCKRCGHVTNLAAIISPAQLAQLTSLTCDRCGHHHSFTGLEAPDERLLPIASALGGTVEGPCLIVPGYDVQISIEFSSGTASGVSLQAITKALQR